MNSIAFVTPIFPYPLNSGSRIRIYHLIRRLASRYDVRLISLEPGEVKAAQTALDVPVEVLPEGASAGEQERNGPFSVPCATLRHLREFLARSGAQVVHVEKSIGAAMMGLPRRSVSVPLVLDEACTHYVSYRREARWAAAPLQRARAMIRWLRMRGYERRLARVADAVFAVSELEAAVIRRMAPETRVVIVPNGVDCKAVQPQPLGTGILFCGALSYGPNRDAALQFLKRILPRLRGAGCRAEVMLVGAGLDDEIRFLAAQDGRVALPGLVEDMMPWYARAAVVVNPMRGGGGTRLKVLEAMAAGRPVVTSSIGVEGIEVPEGMGLCVADAPSIFAEKVHWLLAHREQAEAMGRAGRALVEARYDWTRCLAPLETLYSELLPKRAVSC